MSDHVAHNRAFWDADSDDYQAAHGAALTRDPLAWGAYRRPESELQILGDVRGVDVLELGCGAAQWSIALATTGARIVGIDVSTAQLRHARAADAALPLVLGDGEALPFGDDAFDVVFCDHGALSFCEPDRIVGECARVLRRGGRLAFCCTHPLLYLTYNERKERPTRRLELRWDKLGRMEPGDGTVDWALPASTWFRVLRAHGLAVEDLVELCAPEHAVTTYGEFAPPKWARRWPAEWIWTARRI